MLRLLLGLFPGAVVVTWGAGEQAIEVMGSVEWSAVVAGLGWHFGVALRGLNRAIYAECLMWL